MNTSTPLRHHVPIHSFTVSSQHTRTLSTLNLWSMYKNDSFTHFNMAYTTFTTLLRLTEAVSTLKWSKISHSAYVTSSTHYFLRFVTIDSIALFQHYSYAACSPLTRLRFIHRLYRYFPHWVETQHRLMYTMYYLMCNDWSTLTRALAHDTVPLNYARHLTSQRCILSCHYFYILLFH